MALSIFTDSVGVTVGDTDGPSEGVDLVGVTVGIVLGILVFGMLLVGAFEGLFVGV